MSRTTSAYLQRPLPTVAGDPLRLFNMGANATRTSWHKDPRSGLWYPGWLGEPARIQLARYSEQFNLWSSNRCGFPYMTEPAPDDSASADVLREDATPAQTHFVSTTPTGALSANTTYCLSCFVDAINRDYAELSAYTTESGRLKAFFDVASGVASATGLTLPYNDIIPSVYINGFWRIWARWVTSSTVTNPNIYLLICDALGSESFDGLDQNSLTAWGYQLEAGEFPTSYIPNPGTGSVTRTADSELRFSTYVPDEFTAQLVISIPSHTPAAAVPRLWIDDGTASNRIVVEYTTAGKLRGYCVVGGSTEADVTPNVVVTDGNVHRANILYQRGRLALEMDGVGAEASGAHVPGMDAVAIQPSGGLASLQWRNEWLTGQPRPVQPDMIAL